MTCQKCKNETKGIKLNNKLYCAFCGEVLKQLEETTSTSPISEKPTPQNQIPKQPVAYRENPNEPPVISKDDSEIDSFNKKSEESLNKETPIDLYNLSLLNTEKKVLELIEKNTPHKPKQEGDNSSHKIIKKNRNRAGMLIIKGEPDPISTPELEPPTGMEIASPTGSSQLENDDQNKNPYKEINWLPQWNNKKDAEKNTTPEIEVKNLDIGNGYEEPKIKTEQPEEIKKEDRPENTKNTLKTFFSKINPKKNIKAKTTTKEDKKPKNKKKLIIIIPPLIILTMLIGLVFYVNNVAIREENIKAGMEGVSEFNYISPQFVPPGYSISIESRAERNKVKYVYNKFDRGNKVTLTINSVPSDFNVLREVILPLSTTYTSFRIKEITIWNVQDKKLIFLLENNLYSITSSDEIILNQLTKMAEEIIN